MTVDHGLQRFALALVTLVYLGLFGWLLVDTLNADAAFEPSDIQRTVIPVLTGSLGLVLALALGVEAKTRLLAAASPKERFAALWTVKGLLRLGAGAYLLSALLGGLVWGIKEDVTPDLVTTVVLIVAGYLAAAMSTLARTA